MWTNSRRAVPVLAAIVTLALLSSNILKAGKGGGGKPPKEDPPPPAISYSITLLGTLGGSYSVPQGMNQHGDVVGYAETVQIGSQNWRHAFLNSDDGSGGRVMIDLQDLFEAENLIAPFDYQNLDGWWVPESYDINDNGQIIGRMLLINEGSTQKSFYFRYTPSSIDADGNPVPAQLDEFLALVEGGGMRPVAINNHGEVAGYAVDADDIDYAVVWTQPGVPVDLGIFADRSTLAFDINDSGQVCGATNFSSHAWRNTPGAGFEDLGVLFKKHNASSGASSINNSGQVAGGSRDGQSTNRAFRYTDGEGMKDLGTLGGNNSYSNGGGINNFGDVVGYSETTDGQLHVFLYTDEFGMADLEAAIVDLPPDLDGRIRAPDLEINDMGIVCGRAGDGSGSQPSLIGHTYEAYLLTPLP